MSNNLRRRIFDCLDQIIEDSWQGTKSSEQTAYIQGIQRARRAVLALIGNEVFVSLSKTEDNRTRAIWNEHERIAETVPAALFLIGEDIEESFKNIREAIRNSTVEGMGN